MFVAKASDGKGIDMASAYVPRRSAPLGNNGSKHLSFAEKTEQDLSVQDLSLKRHLTGLTMMLVGLFIVAALLQSGAVQSKSLPQAEPITSTQSILSAQSVSQQPVLVNGRAVYAVPIVTGAAATAILQQVQANDHAHVVNEFAGWGKSVSTAVGWFRCADMLQANEYRGSQVEVEAWLFLPEQERLEAQAACTL